MKFYKENLKRFREIRGFTQKDLAELIRVKQQAVMQWESGETLPKSVRIPALADVLKCRIEDLCDLIPPTEPDTMRIIDHKLGVIVDLWSDLTGEQQSELVGMAKAFSLANKKISQNRA